MVEDKLVAEIWLGLLLWSALYVSDYCLTIFGARLYHAHLKKHIVFEGSYEMTPYFQQDVDAFRWWSPRFLRAWAISLMVLSALWYLGWLIKIPEAYALALGGLLLRQIAVHFAHARGITLSLLSRVPGALTGKTEYARWLLHMMSAREYLTFAMFFFLVYVITSSWLFLGGGLFTLAAAIQSWGQARERRSMTGKRAA